jgi:hypothetical protein
MKERFGIRFFSGILAIALLGIGCGSGNGNRPQSSASFPPEVTPEEMARELGVPNEPGPRAVKASEYGRYSLVVDVFRWSPSNPVLGSFDERYVDLLIPPGSGTPAERIAEARKSFADLAGREFAVISVDGAVRKAEIVSAGIEDYAEGGYRTTPPGAYKLDVLRYSKRIPNGDGTTRVAEVDYPWLRSETYGNSIMYWGLWIFGGYFIHSTTHYGVLGHRASMGCIRQSYPDAMTLFRLRQDHLGMIRIHPIGSAEAIDRFREITTVESTLVDLSEDLRNIREYMDYAGSTEISVPGHAWIDPATGKPGPVDWPNCGPVDCFSIWGRKPPADGSFSQSVVSADSPAVTARASTSSPRSDSYSFIFR